MSKRKKITIITIFGVLCILLTVVLFYYFGASYPYYDSLAKNELQIPALGEGFIPQGLCFDEETNTHLISGYMNDGDKPSRIYIISKNETKYITLKFNNQNYFDHAGGVATYGNIVYLVGDSKLNLINRQSLLSAENASIVEIFNQLEMPNGADCVTTKSGELWVGEFYTNGNYETPESHHITTPSGEQNMAVSYCYSIDENGLTNLTPTKGLSTRGLVQGIAFSLTGDVILSTSYGLPSSNLYYYKNPFLTPATHYIEVNQTQVPIYILNSSNLKEKIEAPSMSEEICIIDDKVFILYESACAKYKFFTRRRIKYVQSLPISSFLENN